MYQCVKRVKQCHVRIEYKTFVFNSQKFFDTYTIFRIHFTINSNCVLLLYAHIPKFIQLFFYTLVRSLRDQFIDDKFSSAVNGSHYASIKLMNQTHFVFVVLNCLYYLTTENEQFFFGYTHTHKSIIVQHATHTQKK